MDGRGRRLALLVAVAGTAIAAAPLLMPVDAQVHQWIQQWGICHATRAARWFDWESRLLLVVVATVAVLARRPSLRHLVPAGAVVAGGAALGELCKTWLERTRPRELPEFLTGNSMPSGHVMNTAVGALVIWSFVHRANLPPFWRGILGGLLGCAVALEATSRVLRGSHWVSDVTASIVLALVWIAGARVSMHRPARALARVAIAFAILYVVPYAVPAMRIHLPSVMDRPRVVLAAYEHLGDDRWRRPGVRPISTHVHGPYDVAATSLWSPGATPDIIEAVLHATCTHPSSPCPRVSFTVNGWRSDAIEVRCGRRWYQVRPPAGVLREGENAVRVVGAEGACMGSGQSDVAVRSLSLVDDGTVGTYRRAPVAH